MMMTKFEQTVQKRVYWQLAKGNINAMMEFFYGDENDRYEEMKTKVNEFIEYIEKESPIA